MNKKELCLYIDSAKIKDWEKWFNIGLFHGITTNPILLERAGEKCNISNLEKLANKAFSLGVNEFQIQLWGNNTSKMYELGCNISKINPNIVVKIPMNLIGIQTALKLLEEGKKITITGVFSSYQFLISSKLGVNYVAPYLGRMNDANIDGYNEIVEMNKIKKNTDSSTEILVASLRNVEDISKLASIGLNFFTINPTILEKFFCNIHTAKIIDDFEKAIENTGGNIS